jgi:hypothetical protein
MGFPYLIILYGRFQERKNEKQQAMIDGGATCMYREMAKLFGEIIYLAPQDVKLKWEKCITSTSELLEYLLEHPHAIVWSVKHCIIKDSVLGLIPNKKAYYSCCSNNMYNRFCDVSLVDLPSRVQGNAQLWVKGKDPNYWKPNDIKLYDFLIMGRRNDKNESYSLLEIVDCEREYSVLWIGGQRHSGIVKTNREVKYTPFLSMDKVRKLIPIAKVGIILSEHPAEGFPQTFLEMSMCGLIVIYLAKKNQHPVYSRNYIRIDDKSHIKMIGSTVIDNWSYECSKNVRDYAVANYSSEKSYESILKGVKYYAD